jgi:hypothetical protein
VNKLRWGKFYWSDWADDPALALCSLAAQGLWMRLLCIAAQGTPYGHVNIRGKAPTVEMLAKLARIRTDYCARLIAELERKGVAERSADGTLTSRRQIRDASLTRLRSTAAKARWNKETGSDLHMQVTRFACTESDAEADSDSPPNPPASGGTRGRARMNGGGRKPSRNGFVDIALDMIEERNAETGDARPNGARVVDLARHLGSRKPPA